MHCYLSWGFGFQLKAFLQVEVLFGVPAWLGPLNYPTVSILKYVLEITLHLSLLSFQYLNTFYQGNAKRNVRQGPTSHLETE